jgi:hypothetical protein
MNEESNIVDLPPNHTAERNRDPVAAGLDEGVMTCRVRHAMEWLGDHPGADYLDAATAVASLAEGEVGRSHWPEFVARVRACAWGEAPIPDVVRDTPYSPAWVPPPAELEGER